MNAFKAMRYAGVTREMLRNTPKEDRLLMWMMIVATVEWCEE